MIYTSDDNKHPECMSTAVKSGWYMRNNNRGWICIYIYYRETGWKRDVYTSTIYALRANIILYIHIYIYELRRYTHTHTFIIQVSRWGGMYKCIKIHNVFSHNNIIP